LLSRILDVAYLLADKKIGEGQAIINLNDTEIEYSRFFPFEDIDLSNSDLKRKGIGTLAHVSTLIKLIDSLSDHTELNAFDSDIRSLNVYHNPGSTSKDYKSLLKAIGVNLEEPIIRYTAKCVDYANSRGFEFMNPFPPQNNR
jgi:hypothetical protein